MWPKFTNICLTVERKLRKNLNQEIHLTGDQTRAQCVKSNDVTTAVYCVKRLHVHGKSNDVA